MLILTVITVLFSTARESWRPPRIVSFYSWCSTFEWPQWKQFQKKIVVIIQPLNSLASFRFGIVCELVLQASQNGPVEPFGARFGRAEC